MKFGRIVALAALALAACSPSAADSKQRPVAMAVHPVSGLKVVRLTVSHGSTVHMFRVELAATTQEQMKGLMFRTEMGANEGMIFPMRPARDVAFWMKNTVIPLDIIFVGTDGRILNIAANAVPYSEAPLPSAGRVSGVLELVGGRAAELGIVPGDIVRW